MPLFCPLPHYCSSSSHVCLPKHPCRLSLVQDKQQKHTHKGTYAICLHRLAKKISFQCALSEDECIHAKDAKSSDSCVQHGPIFPQTYTALIIQWWVSKVASMLNLLTEVSAHLTKHTSVAKLKANQYLQSVGNTLPNYNVSILSLTHSRNIITARLCENTVVWRCY